MKKIDLAGRKFGKLTVIGPAPNQNRRVTWTCDCECGQSTVCTNALRGGTTKSYGKGKGKYFSHEEWIEVGKVLRAFREHELKLKAGV